MSNGKNGRGPYSVPDGHHLREALDDVIRIRLDKLHILLRLDEVSAQVLEVLEFLLRGLEFLVRGCRPSKQSQSVKLKDML